MRQSHRDSPVEGLARRELATPQRVTRFGDLDRGDPGAELTATSQRTTAALREIMGLPDQAAAREERDRWALDRIVSRPAVRYRTIGEAEEHGESPRERAERYRVPMTPATTTAVGWNDGCHLPGELSGLTYG